MDFEERRNTFSIPDDHVKYLEKMNNEGIKPKVIYDIGSCVFHWADHAKRIWPNCKIYGFDGNKDLNNFYENNKNKVIDDYYLGLLSDETRIVDYYKSTEHPGGNSYYPEKLYGHLYKPVKQSTIKLDDIVKNNKFDKPDLIKIDVQGAEIDILRGAKKTLRSCKNLIVELQHIEYNIGAHLCNESIKIIKNEFGFELVKAKFCNNGADADYHFKKN